MAQLLYGSINLSKIDKSKLVEGKTGDKYLSVTIWVNDELDQYGNTASIQQSQTKEERESGATKVYLGNLKTPNKDGQTGNAAPAAAPAKSVAQDDDMPF